MRLPSYTDFAPAVLAASRTINARGALYLRGDWAESLLSARLTRLGPACARGGAFKAEPRALTPGQRRRGRRT